MLGFSIPPFNYTALFSFEFGAAEENCTSGTLTMEAADLPHGRLQDEFGSLPIPGLQAPYFGRLWDGHMQQSYPYKALRTHMCRALGPKTILSKAVGLF